jgi:AraC family transcriptional regulator of adaptative response / DNA-3-methyladenine glycosylase II
LKIARSHRVLVARSLIVDTQIPVAEIAEATGFRSIRQFNHSIRAAFGQSPTALRRVHGTAVARDPLAGTVVHLPYRPPFDWPSLLQFLKSRATPGVESVEDEIYRRTVEIGGVAGAIEVRRDARNARLSMRVLLPGCDRLMQVVQRARRLFDLGADAVHIGSYLARGPRLAGMVMARPGLRVPGAWDGFELAVLAILGQKLDEGEQSSIIGNLVGAFGRALDVRAPGLTHLFPQPGILAEADLESIGVSAPQANAIRALSKAVLAGTIAFDSVNGARDAAMQLHALLRLEDEIAAYISMRALGDPDAFSSTSMAFRKAVATHRSPVAAAEMLRIFEAYRPWRAYAAMHFWTSMQQTTRRAGPPSAARNSSARSIPRRSRAYRRPPLRP